MIKERQNKVKCYACLGNGHRSFECETTKRIKVFLGEKDPLSNFSRCTIRQHDETFVSSEQLYQWSKAGAHGMEDKARDILASEKPWDAKKIGDRINESNEWKEKKEGTMAGILKLKLEQCSEFKNELLKSGEKVLGECTRDQYWGTGLSRADTLSQSPSEWPGRNTMGTLLTSLRSTLTIQQPTIGVEASISTSQPAISSSTENNNNAPNESLSEPLEHNIQSADTSTEDEVTLSIDKVEKTTVQLLSDVEEQNAQSVVTDSEGCALAEKLIDQAMGEANTGASPEILERTNTYLEEKVKATPSRDESPATRRKRKEITPDQMAKTKEKKVKRNSGGIRGFFIGTSKS